MIDDICEIVFLRLIVLKTIDSVPFTMIMIIIVVEMLILSFTEQKDMSGLRFL